MTESKTAQPGHERGKKIFGKVALGLLALALAAGATYFIANDKCHNLAQQEVIPIEIFQECRRTTFISPYDANFYQVTIAPIKGSTELADSLDRTDEANEKLVNSLNNGSKRVRHVISLELSDKLGFELDSNPKFIMDEVVVTTIFKTPESPQDPLAQDALFTAVVENAAYGALWTPEEAQKKLTDRTQELIRAGEAPLDVRVGRTASLPLQIASNLN